MLPLITSPRPSAKTSVFPSMDLGLLIPLAYSPLYQKIHEKKPQADAQSRVSYQVHLNGSEPQVTVLT